MNLKYKNTKVFIDVKSTNNDVGLSNDDKWCVVDFEIDNEECKYKNSREVITKHEMFNNLKIIEDFYEDKLEIKTKKKLFFIKNYFSVMLYFDEDKNKIMDYEVIEALKKHKNFKSYTVKFTNEEIGEFIKIIKNTEGYNN